MSAELFALRPRKGDVWELKLPNKRKMVKTVEYVVMEYHKKQDGSQVKFPRVYWRRLPKGRESSLRVKWLLKYGRLVSRKASS